MSLLPLRPRSRALALASAYWRKALSEADVQARLAANPFRAITLRPEPEPAARPK